MKKSITSEDVVENRKVMLPPDQDTSDESPVTVLPDPNVHKPLRIYSPRLVHREQAKDFVHEVIEGPDDARV